MVLAKIIRNALTESEHGLSLSQIYQIVEESPHMEKYQGSLYELRHRVRAEISNFKKRDIVTKQSDVYVMIDKR